MASQRMTLDDMEEQVRILIGEPETEFITDVEVTAAINRVLPEVAMDTESSLTWTDFATVASTQRYGLPGDCLKPKGLWLADHASAFASATRREKMTYTTLDQFERIQYGGSTNEAEPRFYKIEWGSVAVDDDPQIPGDIWLYSIPDAVYMMRFYYFQIPDTLSTGTDIANLHAKSHMAICYRAAMSLAFKRANRPLAADMAALYRQHIGKAIASDHVDQRDRAHVITDAMNYGNPDVW